MIKVNFAPALALVCATLVIAAAAVAVGQPAPEPGICRLVFPHKGAPPVVQVQMTSGLYRDPVPGDEALPICEFPSQK